jgi:murein DD-endopeptidase MepM/ murein hydrolase activator NlpD
VSPDTPPGPRKVIIALRDGANKITQTPCRVTVVKRAFRVQKLSLKPSAARLYTDAEAEQERKTIHDALARASAEQLWRGAFIWPCRGRVSTGFGAARTINGEIQYRHRGLDIGAAQGTPVVAAADGVVSLVREGYKLHGNTIALDHGQGISSLYLHLSAMGVREGQRVARGDVIGKVGATGVATGPHLHWAVYVGGQAVEPRFWVNLPPGCR